MIKLENVVLASPEQMKFIIEGMRNPKNSWEKIAVPVDKMDRFAWNVNIKMTTV